MAKYTCPVCDETKTRKILEVQGKQKVHCSDCDIWFSAITSKEPEGPIFVELYTHASKENLWEKGEELGLSEKALEKFCYALYEVKFSTVVDRETGKVMIHSVNGMELREPVAG